MHPQPWSTFLRVFSPRSIDAVVVPATYGYEKKVENSSFIADILIEISI